MILFAIILIQIWPVFPYPSDLSAIGQSFKTLEAGESSGEIVNQCCRREPKFVTVGYGINEGEVRLDVGQCRQTCIVSNPRPLKRDEFNRYLQLNPDMDPIQIFLNLRSKGSMLPDPSSTVTDHSRLHSSTQSTSCLKSSCLPNSVKRESYYDLSGEVKEIDVIESCDCVSHPQGGCQRYQSNVKIHVGTPFEKQVDIGQCHGLCDENNSDEPCLSCRVVRNTTISVDGPNGASCLSVIDECHCVGKCFRVRSFLRVLDYTHVFAEKANLANVLFNTSINNNTTFTETLSGNFSIDVPQSDNVVMEPLTKVIDIGRCTGSCSDVPVTSKCLIWSTTNNGTCLSSLTGGMSKCTATKFVSHSYMDANGKTHRIVSVTGCGCG